MTHEDLARHQAMIGQLVAKWTADTLDRTKWDDKPADYDQVKAFTAAVSERLMWLCYAAGDAAANERAQAKTDQKEESRG